MRVCYLDCPAGISGDMVLLSLDAGSTRLSYRATGDPAPARLSIRPATVRRAGLRATLAQVSAEEATITATMATLSR